MFWKGSLGLRVEGVNRHMGNAGLRGCEQDGVQGASHTCARTCTRTHTCSCIQIPMYTHTHACLSSEHMGVRVQTDRHRCSVARPARAQGRGALGAAPGDHHVDRVLHGQRQLELCFVGSRQVVLTEGRQSFSSLSSSPSTSNQPPS